jgi:hypothetical protein
MIAYYTDKQELLTDIKLCIDDLINSLQSAEKYTEDDTDIKFELQGAAKDLDEIEQMIDRLDEI